ncbi:serum factor response D-like [Chelonus insularis]|uniref:serum factor response D-like n=1 Tax=Chelonus insularis TaxID=460826 RepID=UPI001588A142|nr:serum factor response D-like [Chelonus insularis]
MNHVNGRRDRIKDPSRCTNYPLPIIQDNDNRLHQNLVMMMERRLSNVQLKLRRESESSYNSYDSCTDEVASSTRSTHKSQIASNNNNNNNNNINVSNIVKQQPKSHSINQTNHFKGFNKVNFQGQLPNEYWQQNNIKRCRPTLWETLAGLVCSLGALASRAAKMATRRNETL